MLDCRKTDPAPLPAVKEIAGEWRLEANEKAENGQKVWEKVSDKSAYSLVFRNDGVVLDKDG